MFDDITYVSIGRQSGQDTITTNVYTKFENNPSRGLLVIALTALRAAGGGRLRRKTITSPDPSNTGDVNSLCVLLLRSQWTWYPNAAIRRWNTQNNFMLLLLWQFIKSASSAEICEGSVIRTSFVIYPLLQWRGVIFLCIQLPNSNAISL